MRRFAAFWLFIALSVILCLASSGRAQTQPKPVEATPWNAHLDKYQLLAHRVSPEERAMMHLHRVQLTHMWEGRNYHRNLKRWVYEGLPAGTWVLANEAGEVVYKESCGNRLVEDLKEPCICATPATNATPIYDAPAPAEASSKGLLKGSDGNSGGFLAELWHFLLMLLAVAGIIGALALIVLAFFVLWYLIKHLFEPPDEKATPSVVPTKSAAAPLTSAPASGRGAGAAEEAEAEPDATAAPVTPKPHPLHVKIPHGYSRMVIDKNDDGGHSVSIHPHED